jgi:hypothetical protein
MARDQIPVATMPATSARSARGRHARPSACRHRRRSPAHLQASRLILRLLFVGSGGAGLSTGKPQQDSNESRQQGGQAPNQASSGRQAGAAAHARTDHSQGTHEAASHPKSHTRHGDNQAGNEPRRTNSSSLTDALTSRGLTRSAVLRDWVVTSVGCDSGLQGQGCRRTRLASRHCRDTSPRARRTSVRADCSHEPRESPRQSRPGLGEMTNEEVGGSIREGCQYSRPVSGGGSVVLVDEAAEPVVALDLAQRR